MSTIVCQQKSQYWPQVFQTLVLFGYIKPNQDPNDENWKDRKSDEDLFVRQFWEKSPKIQIKYKGS